jgi:hypothetical protein
MADMKELQGSIEYLEERMEAAEDEMAALADEYSQACAYEELGEDERFPPTTIDVYVLPLTASESEEFSDWLSVGS